MNTNGVSNVKDTDMTECDGEKVVTMMDVLQEEQDFEDDANAVLGASDEKNCTYSKGYIKRQAIYACLSCCNEAKSDPLKRAGVCLACSLNCHENHELVELYTKRNFRCDCGNPKFNSHPCQFTPSKTDFNDDNNYNQNFSGLYCICHRPYPDPESTVEDDEMIQCIICEDWLHASHLEATVPEVDKYSEMVCKACMEKNEFLHDYNYLAVNIEMQEVDVIGINVDTKLSNGDSNEKLVNGLTEKLCDNMDVDKPQIENKTEIENGDKEEKLLLEESKEQYSSDVPMETENPSLFLDVKHDSTDITPEETAKVEVTTLSEEKSAAEVTEDNVANQESEVQDPKETLESAIKVTDTSALENTDKSEENMEHNNEDSEKPDDGIDPNENKDTVDITEHKDHSSDSNEKQDSAAINADVSKELTDEQLADLPKEDSTNKVDSTEADTMSVEAAPETNTTDEHSEAKTESISEEKTEKPEPQDKELSETKAEEISETKTEVNPEIKPETEDCSESKTEENSEATKESSEAITQETSDIKTNEASETTKSPEAKADEPNQASNKTEESKDTKRKLSTEQTSELDENLAKKPKIHEESNCVRPKGVKRFHKGAIFWPSNFRQTLCTCAECLTMYKDLSVLFLIDPEDTVFAYEAIGKERGDGRATQYEKGLEALSSLDRIQQINALTEYNKMKDKLLDFLKSFKDRKEIVKEEDIKAFFAGMKPKREPDGVYFCR